MHDTVCDQVIDDPRACRPLSYTPAASAAPEASLSEVLETCALIGAMARGPRQGDNNLLATRLFLEADAQINQGQITAYMMLVMVAKAIQTAPPAEAPDGDNGAAAERRRLS